MTIVDIGAGDNPAPGADVLVDIRPLPGIDIVANVLDLPFLDDSLDGIISRHVVEHFRKPDAKKLLEECFRALKPSGYLRLACPNLKAMCQSYINLLNDENFRELEKLTHNFYGGQDYEENTHYWGYCFESLRELLLSVGFDSVEKVPPDDVHELAVIAWKSQSEETTLDLPWETEYVK